MFDYMDEDNVSAHCLLRPKYTAVHLFRGQLRFRTNTVYYSNIVTVLEQGRPWL